MTLQLFPLSFLGHFNDLRLDIVGIVAVLGEGCTSRIVQASALSYHHALPRLLPAPQALLRHERRTNLPTSEGIAIGVYSGNYNPHVNFFCQLLHPDRLEPNIVKIFRVDRKPNARSYRGQAFGVTPRNLLTLLSLIGLAFWLLLIGLAFAYHDGFALFATILLGVTSSVVGLASWWSLEFHENAPQKGLEHDIPPSDVVIYYPSGAFRIIRCPEYIARLYFKTEICTPSVGDALYRFLALVASVFLMLGLLCMGNAKTEMQVAFAGSYIILNILYWGVSALDPMVWHWKHGYSVDEIKYYEPGKDPESLLATHKVPSERIPVLTSIDGSRSVSCPPTSVGASQLRPVSSSGSPSHVKLGSSNSASGRSKAADTEQYELFTQAPLQRPSRTLTQLESGVQAARRPPWLVRKLQSMSDAMSKTDLYHTISKQFSWRGITTKPKAPEKRFTETLWTVIALTGSSHWLENHQIMPNTEVWREWLASANRMARPIRSQHKDNRGKIISASKVDDKGVIVLPIWNFKGALKHLLQAQDALDKGRPPDPTPFATLTVPNTCMQPLVRKKLLHWAADARFRLKNDQRATPVQHMWEVSLRSKFGCVGRIQSSAS